MRQVNVTNVSLTCESKHVSLTNIWVDPHVMAHAPLSQDTYSMQCMVHERDMAGCASHAEDDVSD